MPSSCSVQTHRRNLAMATGATMPNIIRDDWHRGRLERANYNKEIAMVRLCINFLPIGCQPLSVVVFFLLASISSTRRMHHIPEVYIHLLGVQCLVSLSDSLAGYTISLYQTTTPEPVRAPRPLNPTHCPKPNHSEPVCRGTNHWHACEAESRLACASCGPPHVSYHEPLRLHLQ